MGLPENRSSWLIPAIVLAVGLATAAVSREDASREDRIFPHRMHVEEMEISCRTCHQLSDKPEEESLAPSPETCQECHDPEDVAPYFAAGSYHGPDFRHTHQFEARSAGDRCTICHAGSETCTICHQGENLDLLTHPRDYLFLHPEEARQSQTECMSCHQPAGFCTDCHAAEGVRPGNHSVLGWTRGVIHGAEARRDVAYCAACHDEAQPVCLDCHNAP